MTLFRQSCLAALSGLALSGSRFALTAVLANRLSPQSFGEFVYSQWLVDIAFLICSFGASGAVSRYGAEYRSEPRLLSAFLIKWRPWAIGLPILSGGLVLMISKFSGFNFDLSATIFLSIWAIASAGQAMQTAALSGLQRFDLILYSNLLAGTILLLGALLLPINSDNTLALYGLMAFSAFVASIFGINETLRCKVIGSVSDISATLTKSILRYALNMWLVALLWSLLWSRGELPVVKYFLGVTGVANYGAALTIFGGAMQGVMLGISAIAPQLTRLWGEGRNSEASMLARNVTDTQLLVCGTVTLVLIYVGQEILAMVFGGKYQSQHIGLAVLSMGLIALPLSTQNHLLQITTDGRFNRNTSLVGLLVLSGLAFFLIPTLGIIGAALARSSTMLGLGCVTVYFSIRRWGSTAISVRNFIQVIVLNVLSITLMNFCFNLSFSYRVSIAILSILIMCFSINDVNGKNLILKILSKNIKIINKY